MRYHLTAFLTGAAVMVAEIAAARAIAPHFGTSIVVWTNVIGIILVALSLGYWLGGRLSERRPDAQILGAVITLAGLLLIIPAFATRWIAGTLIADFFHFGSGFLVVLIGSFFAVILLFAFPIALIGMVSPFLVKLACTRESRIMSPLLRQEGVRGSYEPSVTPPLPGRQASNLPLPQGEEHVGAIAGKLYAISTIGSLVGTFLPTLVLLPALGTRRTIVLAAATLIILGLWLCVHGRYARLGSVISVIVIVMVIVRTPEQPLPWFLGGETIAQADSRYQLLRVVDRLDERATTDRFLVFNEGFGIQSRAVFDPAAIEGYFPIVAAIPALSTEYSVSSIQYRVFNTEPIQNTEYKIQNTRTPHILILGNAGGTIVNLIQRFFPDAPFNITGVELDPAVTAITAAHFPPPPKPYPVVHADSRVFLRDADAQYDMIVADAYTSQLTIPPHLVTKEFFELVHSHLTPDGIFVANVNAPSRDSTLLHTIEQTAVAVFPHVVIGKAGETWNYLILASNQPVSDRLSALRTLQLPVSAMTEIQRFLDTIKPVVTDSATQPFTDDWAPLELFTDLEVFEALRQ